MPISSLVNYLNLVSNAHLILEARNLLARYTIQIKTLGESAKVERSTTLPPAKFQKFAGVKLGEKLAKPDTDLDEEVHRFVGDDPFS
jgi:hypothetical protein